MYKIVEFVEEEDSCEIIQDRWMIGKNAAYFPPPNKYNKYIKNFKTELKVIQKWEVAKAKVLYENIDSFEAAREFTKHLSEVGNTENEEFLKEQRLKKRSHPVNYLSEGSLDLRRHAKKLKIANDSTEENFQLSAVEPDPPEPRNTPEQSYQGTVSNVQEAVSKNQVTVPTDQDETSDESESEFVNQRSPSFPEKTLEFSTTDANVTILVEVEKMLQKVKKEILDGVRKELSKALSGIKLGLNPEINFRKISSFDELQHFESDMKDFEAKSKLIAQLTMVHDGSGCYKKINGKVASMLKFMFTNEYLKEKLAWGEMSGRSSGKICLNDCPILFEILVAALKSSENFGKVTNEEVKSACQNFFKYIVKKL